MSIFVCSVFFLTNDNLSGSQFWLIRILVLIGVYEGMDSAAELLSYIVLHAHTVEMVCLYGMIYVMYISYSLALAKNMY